MLSQCHFIHCIQFDRLWVSNKGRFKPACSATETSLKNEISLVASLDRILSKKRKTKVLIRLRGCAGWSDPLLFALCYLRYMRCGFVAKQKILPYLFNFGFKVLLRTQVTTLYVSDHKQQSYWEFKEPNRHGLSS